MKRIKSIDEGYKYLCDTVLHGIKIKPSFERFRHLVYEGKIDLNKLDEIVGPNCDLDGQEEISQALGISIRQYRRLKIKFSKPKNGIPQLAVDRLHEKGRDIMDSRSGDYWKGQYYQLRPRKKQSYTDVSGHHK